MPSTVPVVDCPGCAGREPGAYVGEKSESVVNFPQEHFADERGFLHCFRCGLVWDVLYSGPDQVDPTTDLPPTIFARNLLDANPGFDPREANNYRRFRNLARVHARNVAPVNAGRVARACERIYDAEALATILDLPADVRRAVLHHIRLLSERADLRELAAGFRGQLRGEAVTVATVALVMERFAIDRPRAVDAMLDSFTLHGERLISTEEFDVAYRACAAWYGTNLWRDGPEDAPRNKESKNTHEQL